jgi:hypothetical protein
VCRGGKRESTHAEEEKLTSEDSCQKMHVWRWRGQEDLRKRLSLKRGS